jgi:hypothetical protein
MNAIQILLMQSAFTLAYLGVLFLLYFGIGYLFARAIRTIEMRRSGLLWPLQVKWLIGWPYFLAIEFINLLLSGFDWLVLQVMEYKNIP